MSLLGDRSGWYRGSFFAPDRCQGRFSICASSLREKAAAVYDVALDTAALVGSAALVVENTPTVVNQAKQAVSGYMDKLTCSFGTSKQFVDTETSANALAKATGGKVTNIGKGYKVEVTVGNKTVGR
jgi:hypothetical protein